LRFVEIRGTAWRITELDDMAELLPGVELGPAPPSVDKPPVGWITQDDGRVTLGAAVPLGILPARVAEFLAAIESPLVITPWRSVLVCDLSEEVADVSLRVLAPLGLVFDDTSPWLTVSACTGSPGCAHSAAEKASSAGPISTRRPAARSRDSRRPGRRRPGQGRCQPAGRSGRKNVRSSLAVCSGSSWAMKCPPRCGAFQCRRSVKIRSARLRG